MSAYAETDWSAMGLPDAPGHNAFDMIVKASKPKEKIRPVKCDVDAVEKRSKYDKARYERGRKAMTPAQRERNIEKQAEWRASPAGVGAKQKYNAMRRQVSKAKAATRANG